MNDRPRSHTADPARAATLFDDLGVAVSGHEPLAHHTWLGIGGAAAWFCEPVDVEASVGCSIAVANAAFRSA